MQNAAPVANPTASALADLVPFGEFAGECERTKTSSKGQLRWWLRFREENGLVSSGAVVVKRTNPRSKRPQIFINRPRFVAWLAGIDQAA